jgi:hypothetical protein
MLCYFWDGGFEISPGIIWGEEECGGVATTITHFALYFHARVWHKRLIGGVHYFREVVCAEGY